MRFVGRVAIILIVAFGAAVAHSMVWPITRDAGDALSRARARGVPAPPDRAPEGEGSTALTPPDEGGAEIDPSPAVPPVPIEPDPGQAELPEYFISVERAYQYWEEGMPFVDARTDHEREVGTIEGAVHLETRHFLSGLAEPVLAQLDRSFPVIIFCAGGDCDASENVAQRLIGRGFTEVYIMHEGFGAWEAAGHPTEPAEGG
jgi:rhodanese-related sulfurtransferase